VPQSTTRYGRFVQRQRKYKRRRKKKYNQGKSPTPGHPEYGHHGGKWEWNEGEKQTGPDVGSGGKSPQLTRWATFFPETFQITEAKRGNPPHVKIVMPSYVYQYGGVSNASHQLVGYHNRKVKWIGKKKNKMNGFQRQIWGAGWYARINGVFPDWDPLLRHPTQADKNAGAPSGEGDFWKLPPPWPTSP